MLSDRRPTGNGPSQRAPVRWGWSAGPGGVLAPHVEPPLTVGASQDRDTVVTRDLDGC